jgi:type IV pilus assembly protein PilY1
MVMRLKLWARGAALMLLALALCPGVLRAQQTYSEDFTGAATTNAWYFSGGACLTAGGGTSTTQPGPVVGCATALTNYYSLQQDSDPKLVGGNGGTLPDPVGSGALRFTNGSPYGHHEVGSIVSGFTPFPTSQGVSITFKTITYDGDGKGAGADGADGVSFFLMDGCVPLAGSAVPGGCASSSVDYGAGAGDLYTPLGATGGSLGYSCSQTNPQADGLPGAYLGLGIDEFGNFLNGSNNSLNETGSVVGPAGAGGDNTTTGGLYQPGRIGLRGAGSVNFKLLNYLYGTDPGKTGAPYYPSSMLGVCATDLGVYDSTRNRCETCSKGTYSTTSHSCSQSGTVTDNPTWDQLAVRHTCANSQLWNYKNFGGASTFSPKAAGPTDTTNTFNTSKILNYAALPGGFTVLDPTKNPIASESATTRGKATPIVYNLNITQDGKLSFQLSYNGAAWQNILTNMDIVSTNGALPPSFRFGFAGSTGGDTNIHEILCFRAAPSSLAADSAGVNDFENPEINSGTQLFLASYFPTKAWAGSVTAQTIGFDPKQSTVVIATTPNWDASCVLTGGTCPSGAPASTTGESPSSRVMLTWNGSSGVAFESNAISSQQKSALDGDDPSGASGARLSYLRGVRGTGGNEIPFGLQLYRTRDSVLGDIIDSSPTLVGPPATYPANISWTDLLYPSATFPESGGQSYATFQSTYQQRLNVVYVGANDGFLHGFSAGAFDANNNFINNPTTPNNGNEVLAYMPGAVSAVIHNTGTASLDYSSTQYQHAYFVDATPGTGDVFYAGAGGTGATWHTWVVGGLGGGGPGIYALDVTDPSKFTEQSGGQTSPATTVIQEWTPSTINGGCGGPNGASCGDSMGNISGVPQIRRFHTGQWGFVFGNGLNSATGDAGIFVALIDPNTGKLSLLYYGTSTATKAKPNKPASGIVEVAAADLDSDHIVDYVYAGDVLGNLWRFDLTGNTTSAWNSVPPALLFKEPFGNPITTAVTVSTLRTIDTQLGSGAPSVTRKAERVVLNFGTGQQIPQTNAQATQYASGQQYLYGIWDGDFYNWNNPTVNGKPSSPVQPIVSLGQNAFKTITSQSSLQQQTISNPSPTTRKISQATVCWADQSGCSQYGWFIALPTTNEQIIFNPIISPDGELVVNTFIPAVTDLLSCAPALPTGWTMAMEPDTGAGSPTAFFSANGVNADGIQLNGTGVPSLVMSGQSADGNAQYVVTQTSNGTSATPTRTNRHVVVVGQRMNWIERR